MSDTIRYGDLTFTEDEILGGEAYSTLSLLCDALEIGTLTVELRVTDPERGAALTSFRRNEKLLHYHGEELRGTYYLQSVTRTGRYTYELSAGDALALLDQSSHMGGIYTGEPVAQLVADICNIPAVVQSKFASIQLYGWLPVAKRRENLTQVLFAVGASARVDQHGALRIEGLWDGVASVLGPERVFLGDSISYAGRTTQVSVLEHQYIPGEEEITLFEGTALEGDVVQFPEPAHTLTAEGFSIREQGANFARLSAGSGTLKGKKYIHTTREAVAAVAEDDVPNVAEVTDATLVSLVNSAAVAQRLAEYYKHLETMENTVLFGGERPGDVVAFQHPFGGEAVGCVAETSISFGGRLVADETTAVGYVPPRAERQELLEKSVLLTGAGEWSPPQGAVKLRAVLIGAGDGGDGGKSGEAGKNVRLEPGQPTPPNGTWSVGPANGGAGGAGGAGGSGGAVHIVELTSPLPASFPYDCGQGGAAGAADGGTGTPGTETSFGPYRSSEGTASELGYTDVMTGKTYGAKGKDGLTGGRGGNGGSATQQEPGTAGEEVPPYPGGSGSEATVFRSTNYTSAKGGSGGGGASGQAPGGDAPSGTSRGGAGADAQPAGEADYGCGGAGGSGGGGGGGAGGAYLKTGPNLPGATYLPVSVNGGPGGAGAAGARGGDGCILVYYSVPKEVRSGPVMDRTGRFVLDRLGRRILV